MKTQYIKSALLFAASLGMLVSCDYLKCAMAESPEACMIGISIDKATEKLDENLSTISTEAEAENLAENMDTLLSAIEAAQMINIDVPAKAKASYNKALRTVIKKNYYNSEKVYTALKNARYL